jgi:hypothetical protein
MRARAELVCRSAAAALAVASAATTALAQDQSAALAKEFAQLAGGEVRFVALRVPDKPDEFVGALHVPGVQLLIVWAKYEQPTLLTDMLSKGNYQGVYTDLNNASYTVAASRLFVEDLRVDGMAPKRHDDSSSFDSVENGGKRVAFDGDWRKQKLTEKDYSDAFTNAESRYCQAVRWLTTELKKKGS